MIRFTFALATLGLLLGSQITQAQIAPPNGSVIAHYQNLFGGQPTVAGSFSSPHIVPPNSSVIDHYQSLFHGQPTGAGSISSATLVEAMPLPVTNYLPNNNLVSSEAIYIQPNASNTQPPAYNDIMDTRNYRLLDYRRMFQTGRTPQQHELVGYWRGVNKGIVELVGYRQFIKEITPNNGVISGDNIKVGQINQEMLRSLGWQPTTDPATGDFERTGKFAIQPPRGGGAFSNGVVFNYRDGGNRKTDPANLLVDKVVMLDNNHMLGRATAKFGPVHIPLAYFVLERIQ